jgi:hypothetical protein
MDASVSTTYQIMRTPAQVRITPKIAFRIRRSVGNSGFRGGLDVGSSGAVIG